MSRPDSTLYDRRLVLFTGKGGVGKTTIASGFALSCAQRGQRTLLVEINTTDKMGRLFGSDVVGTEITEIEENLWAVNVTPAAAMEEYALMMLRVRLVYKAVFENRIVSSFLKAVPGLNELVMLGKAYYHAIEEEDGKPVWDKVVVDAPATGHGIFFLQIPSVITSILESGNMYDEAARMEALLQDTELTALTIVTLPEEMPVNESFMMASAARDKLGIEVASVVVNGVFGRQFSPREHALFSDLFAELRDREVRGLVEAAIFRGERVRVQEEHIARLKEGIDGQTPLVSIPYYFTERVDFQTLSDIATRLDTAFGGAS